jgi:hypothetical protein
MHLVGSTGPSSGRTVAITLTIQFNYICVCANNNSILIYLHAKLRAQRTIKKLARVKVKNNFSQSASLSWNKPPIWGLRPDLYYCLTLAGLLIWSALSDERSGLSFTIAAGPRQRSHFRVRVP